MFLLQHSIVYHVIYYFFTALIVLLIARWILSLFRLSDSNPIMLFLMRCTDPLVVPIRRRIPPVGGFLDVSWIFAFVAIYIVRALLLQALPAGW
jgi:YggT family protein